MSDDFKPCPFCGNDADFSVGESDGNFRVSCHDCLSEGPSSDSRDGAIEKWEYRDVECGDLFQVVCSICNKSDHNSTMECLIAFGHTLYFCAECLNRVSDGTQLEWRDASGNTVRIFNEGKDICVKRRHFIEKIKWDANRARTM